MNRWIKHKSLALVVASGLMVSGLLTGILTGLSTSTASASSSPVLTMESSPETSVTDNFNPFVPSSASYLLGATSLIYEPLLQFDVAKPTQAPYKFLATGYTWGSGGTSITFTIRNGVKFNNGSPMTAADVAFTYNLLKQYPDINTTGVPVTDATASGNTVTITFSSSQYTNLQNIASVYIVSQSIWSSVGDPGQYIVTNPVGTGPYTLQSFTPQGFTLQAYAGYWGGPWNLGSPAKVATVEFPVLTSNDTVLSQLDTNQLTWAGNFITGLQKAFESTSKTHKVWFAPVNTVTLYPNLQKWPTNQLAVRQAISLAINRNTISSQGESGFEPPATNASGLTLPNFKNLISPSVASMTLTQNVSQAKSVLEKAGYVLKNGYFQTKAGRVLSIQVTDPASYSDYAADGSIVASELSKMGIKSTFVGQSVSLWAADIGDGNYQLSLHWGQTSISAYQLYNYWLNSSLATGANAKSATGDYERLNNKAMDRALTKLSSATTIAAQKTALAPIEQYVATELPVIPTTYGAAFDEYNTSSFSGWPSASNPYESGSPNTPTNEVVVLHLTPTS
jgi:peptide/nickel transport system substrate-binding protein